MPRRARLLIPGVPLHVIQRGNNRGACFFSNDDYVFYLKQLFEQANNEKGTGTWSQHRFTIGERDPVF
jgi:REP element-mobilizing transposase RayT